MTGAPIFDLKEGQTVGADGKLPSAPQPSGARPFNGGVNQPKDGMDSAEHQPSDDRDHETQAWDAPSGTSECPYADGGEQKGEKGASTKEKSVSEEGGIDAPLAGHQVREPIGKPGHENGIGREARVTHRLLVSLSVSWVCCLIFALASFEAGIGFAIVYGLCWSARGIAAGLDRLFGRPYLPHDPYVYSLMREFSAGRLTLALVALSFCFVLYDFGRDIWALTTMALAVFAALQAAYEDISVFGLPRSRGEVRS